jgi:hypothetical protein
VWAVDNARWAFDVLELAIAAVDLPAAAAELLRHKNDAASEFEGAAAVAARRTEACTAVTERVLAPLFLVSDILMNTSAKVGSKCAPPRGYVKAAGFLLPALFHGIAVFVAELSPAIAAAGGATAGDIVATLEHDAAPWAVVGWARLLIDLWNARGVMPMGMHEAVRKTYPFMVKPA